MATQSETTHRGFKIVRYASGDGSWIIYNALGHVVGGDAGFHSAWSAITYIDEMLSP